MSEKRIYKYIVNPDSPISMPKDAQILSVGVQVNNIFIWAMVDADNPIVQRRIIVQPTGPILDSSLNIDNFIDTVFIHSFIFHVFDLGETT